jgi:hypothetical protein
MKTVTFNSAVYFKTTSSKFTRIAAGELLALQ